MHHAINEYQLRLDVQRFLWPVYYIVILYCVIYAGPLSCIMGSIYAGPVASWGVKKGMNAVIVIIQVYDCVKQNKAQQARDSRPRKVKAIMLQQPVRGKVLFNTVTKSDAGN